MDIKTKQPSQLEARTFHKLADLFPLTEGKEFEALVDDIRRNGLREPITRYEGAILDGRNRFRACERADVIPNFRDYDGDDPFGFVVSANVHRRHLTESQRAMAAKRAETTTWGRPKKGLDSNLSRTKLAAIFNVGPGLIWQAGIVQAKGIPELIAAVDRGDAPLNRAVGVAKRSREQQRAWLHDPRSPEAKAKSKVTHTEHDEARQLADDVAKFFAAFIPRAEALAGTFEGELIVQMVRQDSRRRLVDTLDVALKEFTTVVRKLTIIDDEEQGLDDSSPLKEIVSAAERGQGKRRELVG
jgi:hypothetical protein